MWGFMLVIILVVVIVEKIQIAVVQTQVAREQYIKKMQKEQEEGNN